MLDYMFTMNPCISISSPTAGQTPTILLRESYRGGHPLSGSSSVNHGSGLIESAVAQYRVKDITAPPGKHDKGLIVPLALVDFAVIVGLGTQDHTTLRRRTRTECA